MSPELEKILYDKYPKIFDSNDHMTRYGISCGDGWFNIIDSLCRNIQSHVEYLSAGIEDEEEKQSIQVVAQQIKEKFGSLRFYHSNGDDYISGMVRMAESFSEKTCEYCGNKAEVRTKGWIKNLCSNCAIEKKS